MNDLKTLRQTARILAGRFGDPSIDETAVLLVALEGEIKLSVRVSNSFYARQVEIVPADGWPSGLYNANEDGPGFAGEFRESDGTTQQIFYKSPRTDIYPPGEVFDLPMIGGERRYVESLLTGEDVCLDDGAPPMCTLIEHPAKGLMMIMEYIELSEEEKAIEGMPDDGFVPANCLPAGSLVVCRVSAMDELHERMGKKYEMAICGDHGGDLANPVNHPELFNPGGGQGERQPAGMDLETDIKMVQRLKDDGVEDKVIAHKLKEAFPKIYPSRVGRLITGVPGVFVTTDAFRKRGKKLLE